MAFVRDCIDCFPGGLQERYRRDRGEELSCEIAGIMQGSSQSSNKVTQRIFNNPFCPDTFDGVNRACLSFAKRLNLGFADPESLLTEVSSCGQALVVHSKEKPGLQHPLIVFHRRMKRLYDEVISHPRYRAGEAMLTRAVELAYMPHQSIEYSKLTDAKLARQLHAKEESRSIWTSLEKGDLFVPLSLINPRLYKEAIKVFYHELKVRKHSIIVAREVTSEYLARRLQLPQQDVIPHMFRTLVWKSSNIYFEQADSESWEIKWHPSEGTYEKNPIVEVYVPPRYEQLSLPYS